MCVCVYEANILVREYEGKIVVVTSVMAKHGSAAAATSAQCSPKLGVLFFFHSPGLATRHKKAENCALYDSREGNHMLYYYAA